MEPANLHPRVRYSNVCNYSTLILARVQLGFGQSNLSRLLFFFALGRISKL